MTNGSSVLRLRIAAASLALLLGVAALTAHAGEAKVEQCLDPEICPIPYVRLAKQETEPFLRFGNVVNKDHPRYGDYKRALRRFPDVRSCLMMEAGESPQPDLRHIDWNAMRDIIDIDIDVCVFRISSSIEDIEYIKRWLEFHDFSIDHVLRHNSEEDASTDQPNPIRMIDSSLSIEKFRKIIQQSWFARVSGFEIGRSYEIIITFSRDRQVKGVDSLIRSIFDE